MEPHQIKKPKIERSGDGESVAESSGAAGHVDAEFIPEQEEALVALIEHRAKEVQTMKGKIAQYESQLEDAQKKLRDARDNLAGLRSPSAVGNPSSKTAVSNGLHSLKKKVESASSSPFGFTGGHHRAAMPHPSRPQLVIPAINSKITNHNHLVETTRIRQSAKTDVIRGGASTGAGRPTASSASPAHSSLAERSKLDSTSRPISERSVESREKRNKKSPVPKVHHDLIPSIRTCASPCLISVQPGNHISSQHKRKLRSLVLNPVNDQMFATSALDGVVNLWQVQIKGSSASLLSTTNCVSPKQRRWPEDLTWHPDGDTIFAAYSADGGDSQISLLNLNCLGEKRVTFLEEKPHLKGIINNIMFMPWDDLCFVTGGSDHAVIIWHEKDGSWKPKVTHKNEHSSAVMGVAGLQQKKTIMSAGADKRIIGFDLLEGRFQFKHQIDSKCMSVVPNPSDFNLFMVQTGVPGKQLRLFDIRLRKTEIHAFGWMQESSESQSALINQSWSPDGWYIFSGSADPVIHIFDIRYRGQGPSQSVQAHQKRVFKAVWHESLHLITSISSDLNIGLHRIT